MQTVRVKRGYCLDWPFLKNADVNFREDSGEEFKGTTNYLFMQPPAQIKIDF